MKKIELMQTTATKKNRPEQREKDLKLFEKIDKYAKELRRSNSSIVKEALEEYAEKHKLTLEECIEKV